MDYIEFLSTKTLRSFGGGLHQPFSINPYLFGFQAKIVEWALKRGRSAVFADTGLGKTFIQIEWARHIAEHTHRPVLILAPLAVSMQTVREAQKIGVAIEHAKDGKPRSEIVIANYERLHYFNPDDFSGLVLDESSILKSFDGFYRKQLIDFASKLEYRLACTATPAPNDIIEITNHADFLGVMSSKEVLALFFIQDGNTTHKWRLKGHARKPFWEWMASWCVAIQRPSDMGFSDEGFALPPLRIHEHAVVADNKPDGMLFDIGGKSLDARRDARRRSIDERCRKCVDIVAEKPDEQWLVWCDLNKESEMLARMIPGAVEVKGSDNPEHKEQSMLGFSAGDVRVLVTKPSICGFGMNWQNCHNMAFVGLSDSYERYYQAVRRCWRFGQASPVDVHVVISEAEGEVKQNIERKEKEARSMMQNIIEHMREYQLNGFGKRTFQYEQSVAEGDKWTLYLGDCMEQVKLVEDESIGLSVFSPPFPGMYAYTNSERDVGNSKTIEELIEHFKFLMPEILRITKPGRSCCIHLTQGVAFKGQDGYIGIKDFRGKVIDSMQDAGWVYYGEVCIDKDPQVKAIRTKDRGLLFKTLANDSAHMHMALADYMIQFRKPGENAEPIRSGVSSKYKNQSGWITPEEWIEWAAPVWYRASPGLRGGIRETDVLNVRQARDADDEKHLCPLQLGVIERAIKLWSNPGDVVFSPFAGIGSEGHMALKLGRRFIGIELKRSYWESAVRNLQDAENYGQTSLFKEINA